MAKLDLTAARLREVLHYDPETGELTRLSNNKRASVAAGGVNKTRYAEASVDGHKHRVHRLVWLYMTGAWPTGQIDHINRDRLDNRWANLRDVSPKGNIENQARKARTDTGLRGIRKRSIDRSYCVDITQNRRLLSLGTFDDLEMAKAARRAAELSLHSCSPEHQRPTDPTSRSGAALAVWELAQRRDTSLAELLPRIESMLETCSPLYRHPKESA